MSGSNPISIKRKYTNRPCIGPICRGKKMMRSSGPQHRICNHCKEFIQRSDAVFVDYETAGALA